MGEVQSAQAPVARLDPTVPIKPGTLFTVTTFITPDDDGLISWMDLERALNLRSAKAWIRGIPSIEIGE